jgi:hypothetical protein
MDRLEWRRFLKSILRQWEASGVDFRISREKVGCGALVEGVTLCDDRGDFSWAVSYFTAEDLDLANGVIHTGTVRYSTALPFYEDSLRGILCHEFGHSLGLDHNTEPDSCMSGQSVYPSADDIATLQGLYGGTA